MTNDDGFEHVTEAVALERAKNFRGSVVLDFDETLYLRNSTEDFLDTAAPGTIAKIVLSVLDALKPWKFIGGEETRDVYRVLLISVLFPWTWLLWKSRVKNLGNKYLNTDLRDALSHRDDLIIASIGFATIIRPLLDAMAIPYAQLSACRLLSPRDRISGKQELIRRDFGNEFLKTAMVVTDSRADADVLRAAGEGLLVKWPNANYRFAHADVYLPFQYLSLVKRPGQRYLWRSVIQDDLAFWLLATVPVAALPVWHTVGTPLLLISFWAIYETGYVDNDRVAERYEKDPRLSDAYFTKPTPTPTWQPWIWAGVTGWIGLALTAGGTWPQPEAMASWAILLLAISLVFRAYNRIAKPLRVLVYPILQAFRVGAIAAVAAVAPIAVGCLCAAVASAWIGYIAYRQRRDNTWPDLPLATLRLVATVIFSVLLLAALGLTTFNLVMTAILVSWMAVRARNEISELLDADSRGNAALISSGQGPAQPNQDESRAT